MMPAGKGQGHPGTDSARRFARIGRMAAWVTGIAISSSGVAADFPTRAIRIVVPHAPGGASETMVRLVADRMSQSLKQAVLINNRPGGGTVIGPSTSCKEPDAKETRAIVNPNKRRSAST